MITSGVRGDPNPRPSENSLRSLAALLAAGYLRLLAQPATALPVVARPGNPTKPLDSRRPKSVNWVEREGGRDA
jgi:hypothetical protein